MLRRVRMSDLERELVRSDPLDTSADGIHAAIAAAIEERRRSFGLPQALRLPPVVRAVQLIAGTAASFLPLVYSGGVSLEAQPRIVRKPDPFRTRYDFVYQSVAALVSDRYGECFWRLLDHDDAGLPRAALLLPNAEVRVQWDARRILPTYHYRGQELIRDVDVKHIALDRRPGELHGRGPIYEALDYLYPVHAAELMAGDFFASGGVPSTVLTSSVALTEGEAATLKAQYMNTRADAAGGPAVLSGGLGLEFPGTDPQKSQLQESRAYGATIVARLLGIPAALLHVETSGATITYQSAAGALEELVKSTVAPMYLAPLEQAWSELVPSSEAVRFDLADMQRADASSRFALYAGAITAGLLTVEEARGFEGWGPLGSNDASHTYDPVPSLEVPT